MNKLILWDLDGTLMKCQNNCFDITLSDLFNIKNGTKDIHFHGNTDYNVLTQIFNKYNLDFSNDNIFIKHYINILKNYKKPVNVFKNANKMIDFFTKNNICNAYATGNFKDSVSIKLKECNLDTLLLTGGYCEKEIQRYLILEKALIYSNNFFKKKFDKIYVIGDTPQDITNANKLNLISIGVASGKYDYDTLKKYNPNFLFDFIIDNTDFYNLITNS